MANAWVAETHYGPGGDSENAAPKAGSDNGSGSTKETGYRFDRQQSRGWMDKPTAGTPGTKINPPTFYSMVFLASIVFAAHALSDRRVSFPGTRETNYREPRPKVLRKPIEILATDSRKVTRKTAKALRKPRQSLAKAPPKLRQSLAKALREP